MFFLLVYLNCSINMFFMYVVGRFGDLGIFIFFYFNNEIIGYIGIIIVMFI